MLMRSFIVQDSHCRTFNISGLAGILVTSAKGRGSESKKRHKVGKRLREQRRAGKALEEMILELGWNFLPT